MQFNVLFFLLGQKVSILKILWCTNKNKPFCISCWSASAWKRRLSNAPINFCGNKILTLCCIKQLKKFKLIFMLNYYLNIFIIVNKELMCFFSFRLYCSLKGLVTCYATMCKQVRSIIGFVKMCLQNSRLTYLHFLSCSLKGIFKNVTQIFCCIVSVIL